MENIQETELQEYFFVITNLDLSIEIVIAPSYDIYIQILNDLQGKKDTCKFIIIRGCQL